MTIPARRALTALALSFGLAAPASAMSFTFVPLSVGGCADDCPKVIVAAGEMQFDDVNTLVEILKAGIRRDRNIRPVVLLSSNGGNLAAGYGIGEIFRAIRATVIVARPVAAGGGYTLAPAGCASACVFALMGGVERIVPEGSQVGVHWMSGPTPQMFSGVVTSPDAGAKDDSDRDEASMRRFMRKMGVDPALAAFIRRVPHSDLHVMTPQEMARFRLARTRLR